MPFSIETECDELILLSAPIISFDSNLLLYAFLTIMIEVSVFYILGYRSYKILMGFIAANFISNLMMNEYLKTVYINDYWLTLMICEALVIIFEYCFMQYFISHYDHKLLRSLVITNSTSCVLGLIWFWVMRGDIYL